MNRGKIKSRRVAQVGAYERDNFGDILFGFVTQFALSGYETVWTAPHPGTSDDLTRATVQAYSKVLEQSEEAALWTVGGEVGGITPAASRRFLPRSATVQSDADILSPYLPLPSNYVSTMMAPSIVNSVGLGALRSAPVWQRSSDLKSLSQADFVSVRDPYSSRLLNDYEIKHRLAPDVVHALPRYFQPPAEPAKRVLIQCSVRQLSSDAKVVLGEWLSSSSAIKGMEVCFFAAGLAPNHDSLEAYQEVSDIVVRLGGKKPTIILERDPLKLVEIIANSSLWIGSSLHGRIIASSYGIPRASLDKGKLNRYAAHWDSEMPWGVEFGGLEAASLNALSLRESDDVGPRLEELAYANLQEAIAELDKWDDPERLRCRGSRRLLVEHNSDQGVYRLMNRNLGGIQRKLHHVLHSTALKVTSSGLVSDSLLRKLRDFRG